MKFLKTTTADVYNPAVKTEQRDFEAYNPVSEMGRSRVDVDCPFCGNTMTVYIWSICGGGKRCDKCGAILCAGAGANRRVDD